jgi:rod shape-determining protein MreD
VRPMIALMIFGGELAQTTLAPALRVGGIAPDIPFIIIVLFALRNGPEVGCLAGFAGGLLQDVAAGGFLGAQALTKGLSGFFVGAAAGRLWVQNPLVQIPGLVLLSLTEGLARFVLLQLFRFPAPLGELMLYVVLPQALYNGVVVAAIVLSFAWFEGLRGQG